VSVLLRTANAKLLNRINRWREDYPSCAHHADSMSPSDWQASSPSAADYFTTDVGQHQSAQFLKMASSLDAGLSTMGYGLPAAQWREDEAANEEVICISGDSSFQMNLQELGTLVQYGLMSRQ